MIQNFHISMF